MGNITDDIRQHFDTFAELPFTEADSLALSQLAYARMPDNVPRYHENAETADGMIATVPIHDLLRAECYDDMFGKVWSPSMNVDLLRAMSESPRWRNLRVGAYVDEFDAATTKQFSACVFELGNGTLYVAFRGTDSSIVGWKEDFMMAFRRPVASQEAAARYLTCLCSISCCGFSHDDFSGLGRACRPRNGLNWMVLVSPPERTGKDYDQHAPSTVYPSFAAERGIRRVDRAENTCQRADGA